MDMISMQAICHQLQELRPQDRALEAATGNLTRQRKSFARRLTMAPDGTMDLREASALDAAFVKGGEHPLLMRYSADVLWTVAPLAALNADWKATQKRMVEAVRLLPVHAWAAGVPGLGELSLARILGETGDLSAYANPAKVWKRLGLAVMPNGRQRKCADPRAALEHGYSPRRRSVIWVMGESMIKAQGPYRDVYLQRLRTECDKARDEGLVVVASDQATVDRWANRGLPLPQRMTPKQRAETQHRTVAHVHARAKRYMEKRLLRDLWRAWRGLPAERGDAA